MLTWRILLHARARADNGMVQHHIFQIRIISNDGIQPAKELTQTIVNWPSPQNIKELRALFGTFSYYRRFIPKFAERTKQMRKLLQKDAEFKWSEKQEKEMKDLKTTLCSKPILGHPDFTKSAKPFILYVDSSKIGIGAVIAQPQIVEHEGENKEIEVVIAYGSRTLTSGEQHYSAYKKELLGMVYAINHFRYYLFGKKFVVKTDHRALEWLLKTKTATAPSLLYRWQDILAEYDFVIEYVPGSKMSHVDGLSRKGNYNKGNGTIKDLPDMDQAMTTLDDEFWLTKFRVKDQKDKIIPSVNGIDRPKRNTKPSSRYPPSEYVDLPQHFYQNIPSTFQETTRDTINTPPTSPDLHGESSQQDQDMLEIDLNDNFDFPTTEETEPEKEIITQEQPESLSNDEQPMPLMEKEEVVSFDEILRRAQQNDPSMQTILNDLLPLKEKRKKSEKEGLVSKKLFELFFRRNKAPYVNMYWKIWNELYLNKERQILIRRVPLPEFEGKGDRTLLLIPEEMKNLH